MKDLKSYGIDEQTNPAEITLVHSIALLYNGLFNEISPLLSEYDLTPGKFNALMVIKNHGKEEGISQVDISRRLIVTPSNMTRLIDKLEEEKLIERLSLDGDRRVNLIRITARGSQLLDNIWPKYAQKVKAAADILSKQEQQSLNQLLSSWLKKLVGG